MIGGVEIQGFYDWLDYSQTEIPPGILNHIDLKKDLSWKLDYREPYGRCLIAKRDIKEGEVLFVDLPIITGPKQNCDPLCLGCYKLLDPEDYYSCSKCGWPMCGPQCETVGYHYLECAAYASGGYIPRFEDFSEENPMYESVLPLRSLLLEKSCPKKWKTFTAMESHDALREGSELWQIEQKNICDYLHKKLKIMADDKLIHAVTGILDVNCHEVRSYIPNTKDEYRVRGLYPLCAMMSHDCSSNTHHTIMEDMMMLVVASRNISKGGQITGTYTHLLSGTIERRKHLKYSKFFDCLCDRCKDPTELGTYFSALRCSKANCGGRILPVNPTAPNNIPDFACDKCRFQVACGTVNRLTNMIYVELQRASDNDPMELEMIYKKYQPLLHPDHFHLIGIKHSLSQMYGRVEGYLLGDLSPYQLQRKIDSCKDLLSVLDILDPGISRLREVARHEEADDENEDAQEEESDDEDENNDDEDDLDFAVDDEDEMEEMIGEEGNYLAVLVSLVIAASSYPLYEEIAR